MKTAICAIIKDEHLFLKEWIDWHLNLGFDAIHLFEDKGSESHEEIVKDYSNVFLRRYEVDYEVQKLLEQQGHANRQTILYTWFAKKYKGKYKWVAFIDLDEFVFFSKDYNLFKLCEEFEPYSAVLLNWKMMGASGRISRPKCGVIEAYTQECNFCESDHLWAYKSLVNLDRFEGFNCNHVAENFVTTHHTTNKFELYYDKAWLNHYFTKSLEDWDQRIFSRGDTQRGHRKLTDFFDCNTNMSYLKDLYIQKNIERIPHGTYRIGNNPVIAGGNTQKLSLLNCKNISKPLSSEERLERAIREGIKYGFVDNNRDNLVHVIWLGKNDFPEIVQKCLESWKKYLTNQTLCLWTEESIDLSHNFVKLAYKNKAWAFASDYLRLWVIYEYGGIYIDTDVELIKPINDLPKNFMAEEKCYNGISLGLIFGAERGNEVIFDLMKMYDNFFYDHDKRWGFIQPILTTSYFKSRGYIKHPTEITECLGFIIFPDEYFSPKNYKTKEIIITENTYSNHHYMGSWLDK